METNFNFDEREEALLERSIELSKTDLGQDLIAQLQQIVSKYTNDERTALIQGYFLGAQMSILEADLAVERINELFNKNNEELDDYTLGSIYALETFSKGLNDSLKLLEKIWKTL